MNGLHQFLAWKNCILGQPVQIKIADIRIRQEYHVGAPHFFSTSLNIFISNHYKFISMLFAGIGCITLIYYPLLSVGFYNRLFGFLFIFASSSSQHSSAAFLLWFSHINALMCCLKILVSFLLSPSIYYCFCSVLLCCGCPQLHSDSLGYFCLVFLL